MDTIITTYRKTIKDVLNRYYNLDQEQPTPGVDSVIAFDEVRDHYFWLQVGWDRTGRTCGPTVYIRIHDHKIWIEEDLTEDGIVGDLLAAGIAKESIVLGFQHPRERLLTEFAAA